MYGLGKYPGSATAPVDKEKSFVSCVNVQSLSLVRWIVTSDGIVEGIEGGGGSHSVSEHMVNVVVFELEDSVREPDLRGQHLHVAAEQGANPR